MAEPNQQPGTQQQEPGAQQQPGTQPQTQQPTGATIDYDKIQQMIDRGTAQKESAILKSYFAQLGLTEDEAKTAIEGFKTQKAAKNTDLAKENEALRAQIYQGKVDAAVAKVASDLKIDAANIPFVVKLADLSGIKTDKGDVDNAKVKEALEKVLNDVPAFKATGSDGGKGFQVGGKGAGTDKPDDAEKRLRAAFGLK